MLADCTRPTAELVLLCTFFVFAVGAAFSRIFKYGIAHMCPVLVSRQLYKDSCTYVSRLLEVVSLR